MTLKKKEVFIALFFIFDFDFSIQECPFKYDIDKPRLSKT